MSATDHQLSITITEAARIEDALMGRVRRDLAIHHLQAARTFALKAREIEDDNNGAPLGSFFESIIWHASSSIIMSVAALEANANEILKDLIDDSTKSERVRLQCEDLYEARDADILDKYRRIALILDHKLDKGTSEWENAKLLAKFRNALVHFRPSVSDESRNEKLSQQLTAKFQQNAWFTVDGTFPLNCFGYPATRWAIKSVRAFSRMVAARIRVRDRLAEPTSSAQLDLP